MARLFLITQEVMQSNSYDYSLHFGKTQTVRINSEAVFFKNVSMKTFLLSSFYIIKENRQCRTHNASSKFVSTCQHL